VEIVVPVSARAAPIPAGNLLSTISSTRISLGGDRFSRRNPWNVLPVIVLTPDQTLKLLVDIRNATPDRKQSSIIRFAIYTSENI